MTKHGGTSYNLSTGEASDHQFEDSLGHITRSYLKNKKKEQGWKERKKKENVIKMRDRRGNKECKREVIEKGRKKKE